MQNKLFLIFIVLALSQFPNLSAAQEQIDFQFLWDQPETKLELKMFLAPLSMVSRVGETGEYTEKKDLPFMRELEKDSLKIVAGDQAVIYLVAKNPGKKQVRFYVAPHQIHPAAGS
jgi:hypothetical protein